MAKQIKVGEAAAIYDYSRGTEDEALTTISSKNQITLPVQLLRELGVGPGDRLAITREGTRLMLRVRPKDWVAYYAGSLAGVYGKTAADIESYVAELRASEPRDEGIERAWAGTEPDPQ